MYISQYSIISKEAAPWHRQLYFDVWRRIKSDININLYRHLCKVHVILFRI